MISRRFAIVALAIGIASFSGLAQTNPAGVPNFHQVNDHVYRGAQPTDQGFQSLSKLGVKTVIDLREAGDRSVSERKVVEAAGMRYIAIPFQGMSAPSPANVAKVLALFDDASAGPVFVHCRRGADRTGTVVACYRIAHDHWDNQKALHEAKSFGMSWTEVAMHHYVLRYQPQVNTAAGMATAAGSSN
jgi:tyrosine-protein phosphatase SIW14